MLCANNLTFEEPDYVEVIPDRLRFEFHLLPLLVIGCRQRLSEANPFGHDDDQIGGLSVRNSAPYAVSPDMSNPKNLKYKRQHSTTFDNFSR